MPRAWTRKDERQYEHIKEQQREEGRSEERAKEIAARTVNRQRRKEGRVSNGPSRATGNPNIVLEDRTRRELYNRARDLHVSGRSQMTKKQLVEAIRSRG